MISNGQALLNKRPIVGMFSETHRFAGVSHGLSEAGYDICIKQDIYFTPPKLLGLWPASIKVVTSDDIYEALEWPEGPRTATHRGRFALASATCMFDMPDDLVGVVHDKSTWARQGVSVFNTVIEPGWRGYLTLEIVFHGNKPVHLPAGAGIAQVLFHTLERPASYSGKYQNQANNPVPSIFEETHAK